MPTAEHIRYFFTRLENPKWIVPLAAEGFFESPPQAQRDPASGAIAYVDWPQLDYLGRMAPDNPAGVTDILGVLPDCDNAVVLDRLAQIALLLPAEQSLRLVPYLMRNAPAALNGAFPDLLGQLAASLAGAGQPGSALDLCRVVLRLDCVSRDYGGPIGSLRDPVPRIDEWSYRRICERDLPLVIDRAGRSGLRFVSGLLAAAVRCVSGEPDGQPYDGSSVWHSDIEADAEINSREIPSVLLVTARDAFLRAINNGRPLDELEAILFDKKFAVFIRLWLFLVRRCGSSSDVDRALAQPELFETGFYDREGFDLLADRWMDASEVSREAFLEGIGVFEPLPNPLPGRDDPTRYQVRRRQRFLSAIGAGLPERATDTLGLLEAGYGRIGRPDDGTVQSWVGPTAPFQESDLGAKSVGGLISLLEEWKPNAGFAEPTREGLGRVLTSVAKGRAQELSAAIRAFRDLDPTYVRAALGGLEEAVREGTAIVWPPVLEVCQFVANHAPELERGARDEGEDLGDSDPNWSWAKGQVISLLEAGFRDGSGALPRSLRHSAWAILKATEWDPNPTVKSEAENLRDPLMGALNSTRGKVARAVIAYALWLRRDFEAQGVLEAREAGGLDEMPEVVEYLEDHLDVSREPSASVRAVFGEYLPYLVLLGPEWVEQALPLIFPSDPAQVDLRLAAWETYISRNALYTSVATVAHSEYQAALLRVGRDDRWRSFGARDDSATEGLGRHIIAMLLRGVLSPGDPFVTEFFARASDSQRGRALARVGDLRRGGPELPGFPAALGRFAVLWHRRLRAACEARGPAELGAIAWWLELPFSSRWLATQLQAAARCGAELPANVVLDHLPVLALAAPAPSLEVLSHLFEAREARWLVVGHSDQIREVLRAALRDRRTSKPAIDLIQLLGARGLHDFRDLVSYT